MDALVGNSPVVLRGVDPISEGKLWDEIVFKHPQASPFHGSAWIRVLWETYGFRPYCYTADGPEPAVLAFAEVDSWLTGRRGISLPFTDSCPLLPSREHTFQDLWNRSLELGRERSWKTIEIRGIPENSGFKPSLSFYNHVLPLSEDPVKVFDSFDSSVRRAIRKADKSEVKIEIGQDERSMRQYYELHCLTRKKHGLPPQSFRFFSNILQYIVNPGLGFIALARVGSKAIAGAVFFERSGKAVYKFGASSPEGESLRANNLVMWSAIQALCERGARSLDFGRSSIENEGLRRYKLGWGTRETVNHYSKWNFQRLAFVTDRDRAQGWQNTIFRIFPISISRYLGKVLYPHIA